jgi:predicted naringenin-chalcone synthase
LGKNIDDTKEVLRLYGNMSSATVLCFRTNNGQSAYGGERVNVEFGPGFSAQRVYYSFKIYFMTGPNKEDIYPLKKL